MAQVSRSGSADRIAKATQKHVDWAILLISFIQGGQAWPSCQIEPWHKSSSDLCSRVFQLKLLTRASSRVTFHEVSRSGISTRNTSTCTRQHLVNAVRGRQAHIKHLHVPSAGGGPQQVHTTPIPHKYHMILSTPDLQCCLSPTHTESPLDPATLQHCRTPPGIAYRKRTIYVLTCTCCYDSEVAVPSCSFSSVYVRRPHG
jgi:hypothetical protein